MKEYSVKITSLTELMKFEDFVRKNHLHGELRQRDFKADIRSGFWLFMGLPFDQATVRLENCPENLVLAFS